MGLDGDAAHLVGGAAGWAHLAVALGLLWMAQGLGLVHWPADSFMIDTREWTVRGGMMAAAGLLLIVLARK
jgi:hypothetical protein